MGNNEKYYRIKNIDCLKPAKYERYFGLAIIYKKDLGLAHFHPCKNIWDLFEFVAKYFAKTGIKLENPHPLASGKPLDRAIFKNLTEIVG